MPDAKHHAHPPSRQLGQPLQIDRVLGDRRDPALAAALHPLEHRGLIDTVWLPLADMARRRMRMRSAAGQDVAIALPRAQSLFDGAVLRLDEAGALVARAEAEQWLRLQPGSAEAALALGYRAGNLHWRVRFEGAALLVALEGPAESYLARLDDLGIPATLAPPP